MNVKNVKEKNILKLIQIVNVVLMKIHNAHQYKINSIFYKHLRIMMLHYKLKLVHKVQLIQSLPLIKMIQLIQLIRLFKVQLLNALKEFYIVVFKIKMYVPNVVLVMFGIN